MAQTKQAKPFKRVLIANRGEIALRIIRALRELELESVAIYSDADRTSQHVRMADFAVNLPGVLSSDTYLNVPAILHAIKESGAEAVHPGYGFLSENADFVKAVRALGCEFIGPSAEAMHKLGDKVEAKRLMQAHGVPTVPGSDGALESVQKLQETATKLGYPLILKAAAGGGGRGMRVVREDSELADAFAACTREAQSYFGNPQVFCERYIEHPRHIEFQVLFDKHGNGVHLFERDCSIQRRHQKLIEEAPSPYLSAAQRAHIGDIAVKAAKAAGYESAGTIEFICESPEKAYFMEMNTRIQVEHPVTEMITGVDLVKQQILIALGHPLPFAQKDLAIHGWSFEARINAEDPAKDFQPSPGIVHHVQLPAGPGVRVDTHLYSGYEIPSYYDSMVAKVITWDKDRKLALKRLERALGELELHGVATTAKFHEAIAQHKKFQDGDVTTRFIEENADYFSAAFTAKNADTLVDKNAAALVAAALTETTTITCANTADRVRWTQAARAAEVQS